MSARQMQERLEVITRDLDLLVFRLEQAGPADVDALRAERKAVRQELERLHAKLDLLVRSLE